MPDTHAMAERAFGTELPWHTSDIQGGWGVYDESGCCLLWENADAGVDVEGVAKLAASAPVLKAALERIAVETRRKQLPITNLINEIATEALAYDPNDD